MPCSDHAVLLKATAQHDHQETTCGLPARVMFHEDCYQKHTNTPHNEPKKQMQRIVAEKKKKR
jgi:hypothetical protein